jgi:membrane protease YdiL (CAAX protease family)
MGAGGTAPSNHESSAGAPSRRRDLTELAIGYALILIVIWTPRPWQRLFYCATALYLAAVLCVSFPGWPTMGLRTTNFARSLWVAGVALSIAAIAILIAAHARTLNLPATPTLFIQRYWGYALWAFAQQLLLQDFFLLRFLRLIRSPHLAALAAAATFSLAHLPNPILTVVTFFWGLAACLLFLRYRNLYPLAIAHAILGITITLAIPGAVTRNMRVGLGYLTYSSHIRPHTQ